MTSAVPPDSELRPQGTLRCAVGLVMTFVAITVGAAFHEQAGPALGSFWRTVATVAAGVVGAAGVGAYLSGTRRRRLARQLAASRTLETADDVVEPFVLYLRPFSEDAPRALLENPLPAGGTLDDTYALLLTHRTEEEQFADVFGVAGGLVAVGAPHEHSIVPGAHRIRLADQGAEWRVHVSALIDRARFVVVHLGTSEGTLWEIFRVLASLPSQRFAMLVPMNHVQYGTFLAAAHAFLERHRADPEFASLRATAAADLFPPWSLDSGIAPSGIVALIYYGADRTEHSMVGLSHTRAVGQDSLYFGLEPLLRPLLRRMLDHEQEAGPRIDDRARWFHRWRVPALLPALGITVVLAVLVVICGLLTGFADTYPFVLLAATAFVGLSMGVGRRARTWPGPARAGREPLLIWLVLAESLAVIAFLCRDVPVSLVAAGAAGFVACYVGLAVASFRRLVDLLLAAAAGVLVGLAHRAVLELLVPGAVFAGLVQTMSTVMVCSGVMAALHRADRTRLANPYGATAGMLEATAVGLGAVQVLDAQAAPSSPAYLAGALLTVVALAVSRRTLIRSSAADYRHP